MPVAGKTFELFVRDFIQDMLRDGKLGLDPNHAKVLLNPKYYSRVRKKDVVFDVSLEVCRPRVEDPFFVWIWECKDYSYPVPVDDIEEFHTKLEGIGLHRTKGTVAATHDFQESAITVAREYGIGLVRQLPDNSIITLLEAVWNPKTQEVIRGLCASKTEYLTSSFYGLTSSGQPTKHMEDYCIEEVKEITDKT